MDVGILWKKVEKIEKFVECTDENGVRAEQTTSDS